MTAPATMQSEAMRRSGALTEPATMQSEAMRRSGAVTEPATMQWGHPQPRSGEGDAAMKRSGAA